MTRDMKIEARTPEEALSHRAGNDGVDLGAIALHGLAERLTKSDRALLHNALAHPLDIDTVVPAPTAYQVLWLTNYDLLAMWIDKVERIWIRTTQLGMAILQPASRGRRIHTPKPAPFRQRLRERQETE